MSDIGSVKVEVKDSIGVITFATPKSNALPGEILQDLADQILKISKDKQVAALLIQSAGEKAFCGGASFEDLLAVEDLESSKAFFQGFAKVLNAMRTCGKIVVVRVQGKTTGGGVGLACGADYCVATKGASLALTELNLGIGPFVIGPYVERKIGKSEFTAMAIDAEFRDAQWGLEQGIYHKLFDTIEQMDAHLNTFLQTLGSRSKEALALIKKVSWENTEHFSDLMPERVHMSASLILEPTAKENIHAIKLRLRN